MEERELLEQLVNIGKAIQHLGNSQAVMNKKMSRIEAALNAQASTGRRDYMAMQFFMSLCHRSMDKEWDCQDYEEMAQKASEMADAFSRAGMK